MNIITSAASAVPANAFRTYTISLFNSAIPPSTYAAGGTGNFELGCNFYADLPGNVIGVAFYKPSSATTARVGNLWLASSNANLATVNFTNEPTSGWEQQLFASPIAISPNTVYTISVNNLNNDTWYACPGGQGAGSLTNGVNSGPLHVYPATSSNPNGVYSTTPGAYPSTVNLGVNFWVDVIFQYFI